MYFLEMLFAFLLLSGIALFFRNLLKVNSGEGMLLSAVLVALLFFVSSKFGSFRYGFYALCGVAVVGIVLTAVKTVREGKNQLLEFFSPVYVALFMLYAVWLVVMYHDFIQHIDEFHFWAAAVKYMQEYDRMPTGNDFLGGGGYYQFATSLFHLFFQQFTGYNEQSMYVSASLLMWIGFLLPFSEYKWEDWKKIAIYIGIVYVALFTLYGYGPKSLYVDVPTAAWAGGLACWWTKRRKKKADLLIAVSGLVSLHYFKASAGLLMAVFTAIFMCLYSFVIEKERWDTNWMRKLRIGTGILCALVVAGTVFLIGLASSIQPCNPDEAQNMNETTGEYVPTPEQRWEIGGMRLPDRISDTINIVKVSDMKIKRTTGTMFTKSFGAPLASRSNWKIPFVPFVFIVLILLKMSGDLYGHREKATVYGLYTVFMSLTYLAVLLLSFLFMFAYELSIDLRSGTRYFAICSIFLFVLALVEFLPEGHIKEGKQKYALIGIALFFVLGLNEKFIPNATAIDKEKIVGYTKINNSVNQISQIQSIIGDSDKVYYLCQYPADDLGGAELYNASALYYLDTKVSSYLQTPWKFTKTGSNIRLEEFATSIYEFPSILTQGGYTYLWVQMSDSYLKKTLPEVLECDTVSSGYLYKVVYTDGVASGLELVRDLIPEQE